MDHATMFRYFKMLKEIGILSQINPTSIPRSTDNLTAPTEHERNAAMEADQTAKARDSAMEPVTALTNASFDQSRAHDRSRLRDLAQNIKGNVSQKSRGTNDHRE
jgi:hypothetical protein